MGQKRFPIEVKVEALQVLEEGAFSIQSICAKYGMTYETLQGWKRKYEAKGIEGLKEAVFPTAYSKTFKLAAVEDHLHHGLTAFEVLAKYGISSRAVLSRWIKQYTQHKEFRDTGKGLSHTMTKGRKTTFDERVMIVQECLENGKTIQETAHKHGVSYQQLYQWVRKVEQKGDAGLRDGRGRQKPEAEQTTEEKLQAKLQRMERENERLRVENIFLKKLEEIERRHR